MTIQGETLFAELDALLKGADVYSLDPDERVDLLSHARRLLDVPATIWSPDDFADYLSPEKNSHENCVEVWSSFNPDVTGDEWLQVEAHAEWCEGDLPDAEEED